MLLYMLAAVAILYYTETSRTRSVIMDFALATIFGVDAGLLSSASTAGSHPSCYEYLAAALFLTSGECYSCCSSTEEQSPSSPAVRRRRRNKRRKDCKQIEVYDHYQEDEEEEELHCVVHLEKNNGVETTDEQQHQECDCSSHQNGDVCLVRYAKVLGSGLFSFSNHRDSIIVRKEHCFPDKAYDGDSDNDDDDDETATTVGMDDDDDLSPCPSPVSGRRIKRSLSQPGLRRRVRFHEDVVTEVRTRPFTSEEDKYYLHYDEYDYIDFKLLYKQQLMELKRGGGNQKRRRSANCDQYGYYHKRSTRKVGFKFDVVESIHYVMDADERKEMRDELFYTEQEMQDFLDEFVASLQQTHHHHHGDARAEDEDEDDDEPLQSSMDLLAQGEARNHHHQEVCACA